MTDASDDVLWQIGYIRNEGFVNMFSASAVKDVANQLDWDDTCIFIEDEIEIRSGHNIDGEAWLSTLKAARRVFEDDWSCPNCGNEIRSGTYCLHCQDTTLEVSR